jgi:hypothetical protein
MGKPDTDQTDSHKISPPEHQACEGALGAGIWLSKQSSSKGTVGADTYAGSSCVPPETYNSVEAVVAAERGRLDSNKPPLTAFALPAQADPKILEHQVRDSISGLENQLGYGSGELSYVWFNDDSGRAQVFLLGKAEKITESAPQAPACTPFEKLVDNSLNHQMDLPSSTTEGEAMKVLNVRKHQAALAKEGIPIDASEVDVSAIHADRAAQIKELESRLTPAENRSDEETSRFYADSRAIEIGLPAGTPESYVTQVKDDYALQSRALMLGMDQRAPIDSVKAVEQRIESTPDVELNSRLGLPLSTSRSDALSQSMKWLKDAELVLQGFSPDMDPKEISRIRKERSDLAREYQSGLISGNLTPGQRKSSELAVSAIEIGLPPNSSAQDVEALQAKYHQQFLAVASGLSRDASPSAIEDAQKRSDDVPANMCDVKQ